MRTSGGSDGGLLSDASGVRLLYLENGRYSGCAAGGSGPYGDAGCDHYGTPGANLGERHRVAADWGHSRRLRQQ